MYIDRCSTYSFCKCPLWWSRKGYFVECSGVTNKVSTEHRLWQTEQAASPKGSWKSDHQHDASQVAGWGEGCRRWGTAGGELWGVLEVDCVVSWRSLWVLWRLWSKEYCDLSPTFWSTLTLLCIAWIEKQDERQDTISITYCSLDQDAENWEDEKPIQICFEGDKITRYLSDSSLEDR